MIPFETRPSPTLGFTRATGFGIKIQDSIGTLFGHSPTAIAEPGTTHLDRDESIFSGFMFVSGTERHTSFTFHHATHIPIRLQGLSPLVDVHGESLVGKCSGEYSKVMMREKANS